MPLVAHCLTKYGRPGMRWPLTVEASQMLMQYTWPGNVRELENAIERAVIIASGRQIELDDLPQQVQRVVDGVVDPGQVDRHHPLPVFVARFGDRLSRRQIFVELYGIRSLDEG